MTVDVAGEGMTFLDHALAYAAEGLPVLPLRVGGKLPASAHGKDDATTDPEQIRRWWTENPKCNIGIRPPNGFIVLDVDPRNDGDVAQLGEIPATRVAITGGDGYHLWFRWSGKAAGKLADAKGIDIKTHSGYVVAPPSIHPNGKAYEWCELSPIDELPAHLVDRVTPAIRQPVARLMALPPLPSSEGDRFGGAIHRMASQGEGNRNRFLHWATCRLVEDGADEADYCDLRNAARTAGLDDSEIERTMNSAQSTTHHMPEKNKVRPDLGRTWDALNAGASRPIGPDASRASDQEVYTGASRISGRTSGTHPDAPGTHLKGLGFVDIAAMLDNGLPEPPVPNIGVRSDGVGLFYAGQYNVVFGDPESGKTLLLDYVSAEVLNNDGHVLRLDLDHNGPESTVARLLTFGANKAALRDPDRFLYIEPESASQLAEIITHMPNWAPTLVVVDSLGELIPLCSAGTDKADDFTTVHRRYIKPFTTAGAAVVAIDHLSKGSDSRAYGATGTVAKKRVIGGTSIRVNVDSPFTPGKGGSAYLAIHKDRHGGLRKNSPTGDKEPLAGKFVMFDDKAEIRAPLRTDRNPDETVPLEDVAEIDRLDPPPKSQRDAEQRLSWRAERVRAAYKQWKKEKA